MVNQIDKVKQVRSKYPTPLGQKHGEFLVEIARLTGAKLLRKDAGTHVTLLSGHNVSQDILMFGNEGVDVLGDGEGAATPGWGEKGVIEGEQYDPTKELESPSGAITPPDDSKSLGDLQKLVAGLQAGLKATSDVLASVVVSLADLTERTSKLESAPAPKFVLPKLVVDGHTQKSFGHVHNIHLDVVEESSK